jgi:hypothetical protein
LLAQQPLVETLYRSQQRKFPFGILNQSQLLRDCSTNVPKWGLP